MVVIGKENVLLMWGESGEEDKITRNRRREQNGIKHAPGRQENMYRQADTMHKGKHGFRSEWHRRHVREAG